MRAVLKGTSFQLDFWHFERRRENEWELPRMEYSIRPGQGARFFDFGFPACVEGIWRMDVSFESIEISFWYELKWLPIALKGSLRFKAGRYFWIVDLGIISVNSTHVLRGQFAPKRFVARFEEDKVAVFRSENVTIPEAFEKRACPFSGEYAHFPRVKWYGVNYLDWTGRL